MTLRRLDSGQQLRRQLSPTPCITLLVPQPGCWQIDVAAVNALGYQGATSASAVVDLSGAGLSNLQVPVAAR